MSEKLDRWIRTFTEQLHMKPIYDAAELHGCGRLYALPESLGQGSVWFCNVDMYMGLATIDLSFSRDCSYPLFTEGTTFFYYFEEITAVHQTADEPDRTLLPRTLYTNVKHAQTGSLAVPAGTKVKGVLILLESDHILHQIAHGDDSALTGLNGCDALPEVTPVMHQIWTSKFTGAPEVATLFYRAKAQELILLFAKAAVHGHQQSPQVEARWQEDWECVRTVAAYMKENLSEDADIPVLAQLVHMSPAKLRYTFKAVTGKTVREFRNDLKGERALKLLENTEVSLPKIASDLGFSSTSNFARFFRARYQASPLAYRQRLRQEAACVTP